MTDEERRVHDAQVKAERELLQTLSDLFEQATGHAVDLSAWGLEQLVRVLRNPHAVLAVSCALQPYRPLRGPELATRRDLIGPLEEKEQALTAALVAQVVHLRREEARARRAPAPGVGVGNISAHITPGDRVPASAGCGQQNAPENGLCRGR